MIINLAKDPQFGWLTDSGPLIVVSDKEMRNNGPAILLENLQQFFTREWVHGELASMEIEEKRLFFQERDLVGVTLISDAALELQPMVAVPGKTGFQGNKSDSILLHLPTRSELLWDSINIACARCRT